MRKRPTAPPADGPKHYSTLHILSRNKLAMLGLIIILTFTVLAILAPLIAPYAPNDTNTKDKFLPPSAQHLMGTDNYGRDIFSRVLYGARISIWSGLISVGMAFAIGTPLGGLAGYLGGGVEMVIMRIMDSLQAFPTLVLAITIAAAIGQGPVSAMVAVGIVSIPDYARLMFAQTVSIKRKEYITASRAIGLSNSQIIFRHILPNCVSSLIVRMTLALGMAIITISTLSFLGLGIQPPTAEWGAMISDGRRFIISGEWWIITFPGLAIALSILGFNLLGDGLRDVLDPRARSGS